MSVGRECGVLRVRPIIMHVCFTGVHYPYTGAAITWVGLGLKISPSFDLIHILNLTSCT